MSTMFSYTGPRSDCTCQDHISNITPDTDDINRCISQTQGYKLGHNSPFTRRAQVNTLVIYTFGLYNVIYTSLNI